MYVYKLQWFVVSYNELWVHGKGGNTLTVLAQHHTAAKLQYIPRNMHTVFALLCFVVVIHWLIFPYPSGLLHWHCGNLTIAPVPAKQPWWIWTNTSCEFIMNDCITTTKQSTTKPCAYFLGYTVCAATVEESVTPLFPAQPWYFINMKGCKEKEYAPVRLCMFLHKFNLSVTVFPWMPLFSIIYKNTYMLISIDRNMHAHLNILTWTWFMKPMTKSPYILFKQNDVCVISNSRNAPIC